MYILHLALKTQFRRFLYTKLVHIFIYVQMRQKVEQLEMRG